MSFCCLFIYHNLINIKKSIQYTFDVAILLHFSFHSFFSYILLTLLFIVQHLCTLQPYHSFQIVLTPKNPITPYHIHARQQG